MSQFSPLPLYSSIKLKIFQFNWMFNRRVWNLFWESIWCSVNLHNEISILFCTLEISNTHPEQSLVVCEKSNQSLDGKSWNSHILTALFTGRGLFTPETTSLPGWLHSTLQLRKLGFWQGASSLATHLQATASSARPSISFSLNPLSGSSLSGRSQWLSSLPKQQCSPFTLHLFFPPVPCPFCGKTSLIYFSLPTLSSVILPFPLFGLLFVHLVSEPLLSYIHFCELS